MEGVHLQVIVAKKNWHNLVFCIAVSKHTTLGKLIIIITDDGDYARCFLYNFWCNSELFSSSDGVKMWITCASLVCSTRLGYALTDL